jgi:hypothetical protein
MIADDDEVCVCGHSRDEHSWKDAEGGYHHECRAHGCGCAYFAEDYCEDDPYEDGDYNGEN